jgi:type II secretory pathway component PulF
MSSSTEPTTSFAYRAQTLEGQPVSGTIDAASGDVAFKKLIDMRLRVLELSPAAAPPKARPLRGDDFIAFNQQLAHLTQAGLPIEQGLRLIAQDMRSGRLATTVRQIADDLDKGVSLPAAMERHQGQFPAMYGRLVDAGVRTNNLPGMLFNLSRHLELVQRLRATLWRSFSYPLMVLVSLALVVLMLMTYVIPKFKVIFRDFRVDLPDVTRCLIALGDVLPAIMVGFVILIFLLPFLLALLRRTSAGRKLVDSIARHTPLVGPVLKRNLLTGWCNAVKLGIDAGLDLPAAIKLAGDVTTSPALRTDSLVLITQLEMGRAPGSTSRSRVLSAAALAAIAIGIDNHNLSETVGGLSRMYQEQAEMRMNSLPAVLSPVLLLLTGTFVAFVVIALFAPMVTLIGAASGGGHK